MTQYSQWKEKGGWMAREAGLMHTTAKRTCVPKERMGEKRELAVG